MGTLLRCEAAACRFCAEWVEESERVQGWRKEESTEWLNVRSDVDIGRTRVSKGDGPPLLFLVTAGAAEASELSESA